MRTARTGWIACGLLLLLSCSEADLRDLARDTEDALQDAGRSLEELVDQADGPLREAADRALGAADDARAALDDFRENPTTETRRALRDADRRLEQVGDELERSVESAPGGVRSVLERALESLTRLRRQIDRELGGA